MLTTAPFPIHRPAPLQPGYSGFPMRQIHLDFHTSPVVDGIGANYDDDAFADAFQQARVNSVTVFARCHHGMSYYPSQVLNVHPHLSFDLMGRQIDALHRRGIRAPIYITIGFDRHLAEQNPTWWQRDIHGNSLGSPEEPGWIWMSMAEPAYQNVLVAETQEILDLYGDAVDGFFFDILMTPAEGDHHPAAIERRVQDGLPDTTAGRRETDRRIAVDLMRRLAETVRAVRPEAGLYFNSRFGLDFRDEQEFYGQVEIEALPTGGWGYAFYPQWARYGRRFDLPMLGMTGRFHTHWGDFGGLKTIDALLYECGGILANGGGISIGDQLDPRGRLDAEVYRRIGAAYAEVERVEGAYQNSEPLSEAALVLQNDRSADFGASQMLLEEHWQFDGLDTRDALEGYRFVVLPEGVEISPEFAARLANYVQSGGCVLTNGPSIGAIDPAEIIGEQEICPAYAEFQGYDWALYERAYQLKPKADAEVLLWGRPALFNRAAAHFVSHMHAPVDRAATPFPLAVRRGNVIRLAAPLFRDYKANGTVAHRHIVQFLLTQLVGQPWISTNATGAVEITARRNNAGVLLTLVNFQAARPSQKHTVIDRIHPLADIEVTVPAAWAPARRAVRFNDGAVLPVTTTDGGVRLLVDRLGPFATVQLY
jgi:hypothetical protein